MKENVKIGIIREGKVSVDRRVPFTPNQVKMIKHRYPQVEIFVQSSESRCYSDKEYAESGVEVVEQVDHCDILFGVKEVPIADLIEQKTYFFFSHTIKEQAYNRLLLKAILEKKIRLIDYETITDQTGRRVVAFGRYAGIVGAYNAIYTYGNRYNLFNIRRAYECFDLNDLKTEFQKVSLPPIKIALTGGGRVAKGAMEVLMGMKIRHVSPAQYLKEWFQEPVFTQLNSRNYHFHKAGNDFSRSEFFKNPENYRADFLKYACVTDLLIAATYWDPNAAVLFTRHDMLKNDFSIKVIADITCDIEGSIPSTKKASTIQDPVYDYNPSDDVIAPAFSDEANVSVMAIDNLPGELPRNASVDFGRDLYNYVIPALLEQDNDQVIDDATIAKDGKLTPRFSYLRYYVEGS